MKLPIFMSALAFVAGLAAGPLVLVPALAGPPGSSAVDSSADSQDQTQLQDQVAGLQSRVLRLQAIVAGLQTHKHAYRYWAPPAGQYISVAELRDALAHAPADAATQWIPVVSSPSRPDSSSAADRTAVTDGPTGAP
jgi:hypothetical protein